MDSSKVKNILIVFLLVINLLIGMVYASRRMEDNRFEREMRNNAISGLEKMGVQVSPDIFEVVPSPIYMLEVERDPDVEAGAFSTLLGSPLREELGGGNLMLTSGESYARLSGDGLFDVSLGNGDRVPVKGTGIDAALEVFEIMGFDVSGDYLSVSELPDGFAVDGIQQIDGLKIFNRTYELVFDSQGLAAIRGGRIFGAQLVCDATPSVSAASALFAFASNMIKNGTPCREITGATLGYYAESTAPGFTGINPAWEIVSDLGVYYIDAISLTLINRHDLPRTDSETG
ncbi:MAG: hypothetical protein GX257_09260 [Clostridiales bacterium]|nr:hypothetical protein [Clostridiales bacterium]